MIREPERRIPVKLETDLVVVGGSCTGVFAAVRAARLGLRVAIVEKQNCFGGMATAGDVNVWHSLHDTTGRQPIIGGLTVEVLERLKKRGAVTCTNQPSSAFRMNTEELKIELDELVVAHGIVPFLHTFYAAPVMENGRLAAVIVENKDGRLALRGRQFVDATGDADLVRQLGLPMRDPGTLQPPTTCAKIVGLERLGAFDWQAAVREHGHEFGLAPDWGWGVPIPGMPDIHLRADTHAFNTNAADGDHLTRAEIEGRRQIRAILDVIRSYGPPEAGVALVDLAASIGIRETRRAVARYCLKEDDLLYGRRFEDAIANGSYRVDIHHDDGPGITFRYLDGTQSVISERGRPGVKSRWREPLPADPTFYQIPYRCLVQERISNLALAGRMLDADKAAYSAARVMVNTNQTGEAAGVACALALRQNQTLQELDPQALRRTLAEGGSIVI